MRVSRPSFHARSQLCKFQTRARSGASLGKILAGTRRDLAKFFTRVEAVLSRLQELPQELKVEQREALFAAVSRRDVFAILPTGFGKSLIYQLLPCLYAEIYPKSPTPLVLVVSPLVQLMQEQVEYLNTIGITSIWIGQGEHISGELPALESCSVVFGGPEASGWKYKVQDSQFQERLSGVVIDEVHCITEW